MKNNLFTGNSNQKEAIRDMDSFVLKMKHEDERNLKIAKAMYGVYFVMIFVYAAIYFANVFTDFTVFERITGACYVAAFILFAFIFRKQKKDLLAVSYAVPVVEMLRMAEKRYRFWRPELWYALVGIVIVDIGSSINMCQHIDGDMSWLHKMLSVHAVLIPIWVAALMVGVWKYRRRFRPIYLFAKEALAEVE